MRFAEPWKSPLLFSLEERLLDFGFFSVRSGGICGVLLKIVTVLYKLCDRAERKTLCASFFVLGIELEIPHCQEEAPSAYTTVSRTLTA